MLVELVSAQHSSVCGRNKFKNDVSCFVSSSDKLDSKLIHQHFRNLKNECKVVYRYIAARHGTVLCGTTAAWESRRCKNCFQRAARSFFSKISFGNMHPLLSRVPIREDLQQETDHEQEQQQQKQHQQRQQASTSKTPRKHQRHRYHCHYRHYRHRLLLSSRKSFER